MNHTTDEMIWKLHMKGITCSAIDSILNLQKGTAHDSVCCTWAYDKRNGHTPFQMVG